MATLILLISVLGSASGGMFGVLIWYKHSQKLLTSEANALDLFLGNSTIAALLITILGAAGFWLPKVLIPQLLLVNEPSQEEERKIGDRSSPQVIDAVPVGEESQNAEK